MANINSKKGVIGILTGGGDVPGLNPAIRAVTFRALREGYQVIGLRRGWGGLVDLIREKDFDNSDKVVDYGQEGRVLLTTLTKEFFVPRFMERDEGVREKPSARYPWDGVSGVKPFRAFAATTTVGVY